MMSETNPMRRRLLACVAAAGLAPGLAAAQIFGGKPITILLGVGAGGSADNLARLVAAKMSEALNTPVVVSNRPSAGQVVAIQVLKSSPADGTTLYLGTGSALVQGPAVRTNLPYEPLKDFSYVGLLASAPGVLIVSNALPVATVAEFIQYAKAHPGKLNYGSSGVGTAGNFHMELFKSLAGIDIVHIPGKSDASQSLDLLGGRLDCTIFTAQFALPLIQSGKVKALMTTTREPVPELPKVPTLRTVGVQGLEGLDPLTFFGMVGPAGMPDPVLRHLNGVINQIVQNPEVKAAMRLQVLDPLTGSPEAFRSLVASEIDKWRQLGKAIRFE